MKKTALVTGGSGGIGSEICRVLAEDGWQVAVCYKNGRAAAEALVSELKERGLCAEVFYCDIGDKDSIDKCVAEVRDSLGFVTLLVNKKLRRKMLRKRLLIMRSLSHFPKRKIT